MIAPPPYAAFYAVIGFILLFACLQGVLLRDRTQLVYAGFVGATTLYMIELDTAGHPLLLSRLKWNELALLLLAAGAGSAGLACTRALLETRHYSPRLDRLLLAAIGIPPAWAMIAPFVSAAGLGRTASALLVAISAVGLVAAISSLGHRARSTARWHAAGLAGVFGSVLFGAWLGGAQSLWLAKTGIVLSTVIFAAVFADRTRGLQRERDASMHRAMASVATRRETSVRLHAAERERLEALLLGERKRRELENAGHDLRQPLAAVRLELAAVADARRLPDSILKRLAHNVDHLDELAREYLDRSRTTAPEPAREAQVTSIEVILRRIDSMFRDAAVQKGLRFRCRPSTAAVRGDATRLTRILGNLVANAINYTSRGGVLIGCRARGGSLRVLVCDTGPGLDADELRRVMRPRERGSTAGNVPGSGLGLAIVSELVAELGYELDVKSRPGCGSSFCIVAPRVSAEAGSA